MNWAFYSIGLLISALFFILSMVYTNQCPLLILAGIAGNIGIFYFIIALSRTTNPKKD